MKTIPPPSSQRPLVIELISQFKSPQNFRYVYYLVIVLSILIPSSGFSQTQNRVWVIPDQEVNFSPTPSVSSLINYSGSPGNGGYNAMQDANGNLLFYVIDGDIWDKDGNWIDYMNNNYFGNSILGEPEVCIVPVSGSCTQYYIIAASETSTGIGQNPSPFYVTLDMSLPNLNNGGLTLGALVGPNSTEINQGVNYDEHSQSMHIGVTRKQPGSDDRILFVSDNSSLYSFPITSSGIGNVINKNGLLFGYNSTYSYSELEIFENDQGYIVANVERNIVGGTGSGLRAVVFYYLDFAGNLLSTTYTDVSSTGGIEVPGLEFSPNGKFLYVTCTDPPYIQYIEVASNQIFPLTQVQNAIDYQKSQIELAYDGRMYFVGETPGRLGALSDPDDPTNMTTSVWDDNVSSINLPPALYYGIYVLQDQIDGEVYGTSTNNSPACCDFNTEWDKHDFTADPNSATWDPQSNPLNGGTGSTASIEGLLTIPANANVTIKQMTLKFGMDGKITIERGGKLVIDGTTLTGNDMCEIMWQGVEVLGVGQTGGSGNINDQGQFISQGNSIIEQAIIGVTNGSFNTSSTSDYGGFIDCRETTFNNCRFGIKMWSHNENANYTSMISSCYFTGTSLWYPYTGIRPVEHVALVDVVGGTSASPGVDIVFDDSPNRNLFDNADYGLGCLDTRNVVLQRADFTNCGSGIWSGRATSSVPNASLFTSLTFDDCHNSITLINSNGDNISDNVLNANYGSQYSNFYGVYMEGASDFHITDNIFNHHLYAIWSSNSGSIGGMISSNTGGNIFNECWRGIDCRKNNENLQIKCNTFNNVTQGSGEFSTAWYVGGDLPDQGTDGCASCPAGNEFFRSGTRNDIYALSGVSSSVCTGFNFCYYRHASPPSSVIPLLYTTATVSVIPTPFFKDGSSCIGQGIMAMAGSTPSSAQSMIASQGNTAKQQQLTNELVSWYRGQNNLKDAITYLETRKSKASEEMLFNLYIEQKEFSKAQSLLTKRCSQPDDESVAYCNVNTLVLNWSKGISTPYNMSASDKAVLQSIASGYTGSSGQAQAILIKIFNEFAWPVYKGDTVYARVSSTPEEFGGSPQFKISPNPAHSGSVLLSSPVKGLQNTKAKIRIIDLAGKIITEIDKPINDVIELSFSVDNLKNGIYFVEFKLDGYASQFQKILIE